MSKGSTLNTLKNYRPRNILLNGNQKHWQRGTSFTGVTASGTWLSDRFVNEFGGSLAANMDYVQSTDVPTGKEFEYSMKITNQSAIGSITAAQTCAVYQKVIWGNIKSLVGKRVTFSCWVKTNKPGKYNFFIFAGASPFYCMASNITLGNNVWERVSFRSATPLPSGISPSGLLGGYVGVHLAAGSNFYGDPTDWVLNSDIRGSATNVNFCDTVGNEFYMTGLMCHGSEDEDAEFSLHTSSDEEELYACRAYFQRISWTTSSFIGPFYASGAVCEGLVRYLRPMIKTPTFTHSGASNFRMYNSGLHGGTQFTMTGISPNLGTDHSTYLYLSGLSGLTSGAFYFMQAFNTSAYFDLNGEI